jgi:hypothetical protein
MKDVLLYTISIFVCDSRGILEFAVVHEAYDNHTSASAPLLLSAFLEPLSHLSCDADTSLPVEISQLHDTPDARSSYEPPADTLLLVVSHQALEVFC